MRSHELFIIVGLLVIGFLFGSFFNSKIVYVTETFPSTSLPELVTLEGTGSVASIKIPAVDDEGSGVITELFVQAVPGNGKTLANIDNILFFTDTQTSIRTARAVAENVTGKELSEINLIYTIVANASVITGPSAGGALTVATIAALEEKGINQSVMMTGSINHNGIIGPVGQIIEKAKAAADVGAELFLIPASQSSRFTFRTERRCEIIDDTEFCTIETIPEKLDLEGESGIYIQEVEDIHDALEYFIIEE
jgi:uncharacterized protein